MLTIDVSVQVGADGRAELHLPASVTAGTHRAVLVLDADVGAAMQDLHARGMSLSAIAALFHTQRIHVADALAERGIDALPYSTFDLERETKLLDALTPVLP